MNNFKAGKKRKKGCAIRKKGTINWEVGISVLIWIGIILLSIFKLFMANSLEVYEVLNTINSNTFSALTAILICKLYQYLKAKPNNAEDVSGLSRKMIPAVIIITVIYLIIAVIDATAVAEWSIILFFIATIIYIICFIFVFPKK